MTSDPSLPRVRAVPFPPDLPWLNTDRPLSLADLRGKFVVLDFWTYCCINCMHVLPELARLEKEFGDVVSVVGVHSAKFENEGETENIRQAILRYDIAHPVINDREMRLWNEYGVHAWPTLILLDPEGYAIGTFSGEGPYEPFAQLLNRLIPEYEARGSLERGAFEPSREAANLYMPGLAFPGKVILDGDRLVIADSGHHRIVIADLDGEVLEVIGRGVAGQRDGAFDEATFHSPQGLAMIDGSLYVADTDNHLIRRVNLDIRWVETVAGTGQQVYAPQLSGAGRTTPLNSPWDLAPLDGWLYIAMAGNHQIWRFDPDTETVEPFAGNGAEGRRDGALGSAVFAQPSGLTTDGEQLYVADSEIGAIRRVRLDWLDVITVAGGDLFDFGFVDGPGDEARFQHPLGVGWIDGTLWVADTYNHAIRTIDIEAGTVRTVVGAQAEATLRGKGRGVSGRWDGPVAEARLSEPGGLTGRDGRVWIADTNNHVIRVLDMKAGVVSTLQLRGLPAVPAPDHDVREHRQSVSAVEGPSASGSSQVELVLPAGQHINSAAPNRFRVLRDGVEAAAGPFSASAFELPPEATDGAEGPLELQLDVYTCGDDETVCRRSLLTTVVNGARQVRVDVPV